MWWWRHVTMFPELPNSNWRTSICSRLYNTIVQAQNLDAAALQSLASKAKSFGRSQVSKGANISFAKFWAQTYPSKHAFLMQSWMVSFTSIISYSIILAWQDAARPWHFTSTITHLYNKMSNVCWFVHVTLVKNASCLDKDMDIC